MNGAQTWWLVLFSVTTGTVAVSGRAQGTLPATPPTSAASVAPLTATAPARDTASRARRAIVRYGDGLLQIDADNSSLNLILREISRQTGMKISGGVAEQRVFGHYGPAAPSEILLTLLDGTGTNVLIRQNATDAPLELELSPRNGGATPPNPSAPGFDDSGPDEPARSNPSAQRNGPPQQQNGAFGAGRFNRANGNSNFPPAAPQNTFPPVQSGPPAMVNRDNPPPDAETEPQQPGTSANQSIPLPANNVNGSSANVTPTASQVPTTNSVPLDTLATPSTTPPATGIVDAPNPPSAGVVNPIQQNAAAIGAAAANGQPVAAPAPDASLPAGAKTPEQIFQQLQQLRQQQQQNGQSSTTTTTPQPQ